MAIGELLIAASIKFLFEKLATLASGELSNFARGFGGERRIRTLLTKWSTTLEEIEAVLVDADEKQVTERGIKIWLEDLQDLAYDVDDILDEFSTEALRPKSMITTKVRALIPTNIVKLDEITARFQDLLERRTVLGLQKVGSSSNAGTSAKAWQRPPTTCLMNEPSVYGRDEDKKKIIELLLLGVQESSNCNIGVVPIVGMGGVGKTTLAQMVYNDDMVGKRFEIKAWVCVSEDFDIMRVTKAILESVTSQPCNFDALDQVQVQLKQILDGKRFLIVLDDFWNKKHSDWSSLKSPFNDGARGSKVMVTTRNTDVALMLGTVKYHHLKQLSMDDCWLVFAQNAFENTIMEASPNLVSIGRKIVEKCGGLPLAARTLGGFLRCKLRDDEWEDVLNSKMWELSNQESDILPALRLSYHNLPSHLKKCFAYCSILPKNYYFREEKLVLLWMAEGFIQEPKGKGKKQMEDLGHQYFRELLSRSFFQPSTSGKSSTFVMHDLINDLAQFVAGKICFRLEGKSKVKEQYKNLSKARHSSYKRDYYEGAKKFDAFYDAKHLRTFLPCGGYYGGYLTSNVPHDLLPKLRRLRVLSLHEYQMGELPSSIGHLKHLRYLDLCYALFCSLPESLCTLYNLQTLDLRYCIHMKKLPTATGNLINLRHLNVTGANSLQEMPPKIGQLTSLQTLSNFIVSKGNGFMIRELGNLIHLRGALCISGLDNVVDVVDAKAAKLCEKQGLNELSMEWSNTNSEDSRNEKVELEVLDMLQPDNKVKVLSINGYYGPIFPTWVGDPRFSSMVHLVLQNCEKCTCLPPLGQLPSLVKLYIRGMKRVENVGLDFFGGGCSNPFPALKTLHFWDMPEWEDWSPFEVDEEVQAFARLSELSIQSCPKLFGKLPDSLPCLRKLDIQKCPQLVVEWLPSPTMIHQKRNTLHFSSVTSLSLSDVSILDSIPNQEVGDEVLATAACKHLSSVTNMRIENIQKLTCLPRWFFHGFTGLQELRIQNCEELTTLWQNEVRLQHKLPAPALQHLEIENCPQLISLFEEEEEDSPQLQRQQQEQEGLPYLMGLKYLGIDNCEKLEKLPGGLNALKCLQKMKVQNCPSLTYLSSRGGLLAALEELDIAHLSKLESLLAEDGMKFFCPSLKSIRINACKNLKSLPDAMHDSSNNNEFKNLSLVDIRGCENMESLPEGWFQFATSNLRNLLIYNCKKLEARPYNLSYLQELEVRKCLAGIVSNWSSLTNLSSLTIDTIMIGKPPSEWGLHRLPSLSKLLLDGSNDYRWESISEDGMLLPTSLTYLSFQCFPNLEKLSFKDFQDLTSLETLYIHDCRKLTSLPKEGLPPSVSNLYIWSCPKFASFPEQGLPPSLLWLEINGCPKLKRRCQKGKGRYWRFISHIPRVDIDDKFIFGPSC
ncbi:putative disease resistance RPP13-like protein 1 [Camellia sinensis]|uniref:putative disease resistance RPP13-like protein 1 n=1 Tax=Camellia sinensis TaxID=4442 RepID=UPI0010363E5B|nr:putative disease resistance RPP13-like protein 1 [Camellia sinensis]